MSKETTHTALEALDMWDKMSIYKTVSDTPELERIIRTSTKKKIMSLDTETTGLDVITAKCLGYSFSFEPHRAFWVPIKVDPQMKLLKQLVKEKHILFFNATYDLPIIEKYGVKILESQIRDVMIACFFRDVIGYRQNPGLKNQAKEILLYPTVELKDIIKANRNATKLTDKEIDFNELTPRQQRIYGCQDADITMQLWLEDSIQEAIKNVPETSKKMGDIFKLEHQIIRPVIEMYNNGVGIDLDKCAELDQILAQECTDCSTQAYKMALKECETIENEDGTIEFTNTELQRLTAKKGLNLGSFKQKQLLLFEELQLPPTRKTASGYSTDQEALTIIETEHNIVPIIMRYNKLNSRRTSYTKKLPNLVNPVTGRIHPTLWATGVKSGRFSCSAPNMQGISKDHAEDDPVQIRTVFVPKKGNVLTAADYSQIELRIAASLSKEPIWYNAYNAGNKDVHSETAADMWGIPVDEVTSDQRDIAKTANFSILTGISAHTLHTRNRKIIPTVTDAQKIIDSWFKALPDLDRWTKKIKHIARVHKYMTTYFGRVRPFPEIRKPTEENIQRYITSIRNQQWTSEKKPEELYDIAVRVITSGHERKALSHIIQGTAADIMKIAIVNVHRAIKKSKIPAKLLLTVHDELLFEHPKSVTEEFHALLQDAMVFPKLGPDWVPLTIDIGCGNNWAEAH